MDGFFLNKKYIVSEDNLSIYKYPFLDMKDFNEVRFIFLSDEPKESLLLEFKTILDKHRKPIIDNHMFTERVKFLAVSEVTKDLNSLLVNPKDLSQLQAFWVFTTHTGNKIAFAGVKGEDVNTVFNLRYKEAVDKSELFDSIWKSL